ncbi:TrkH family potassium uptake protein [Pseudodesulfovibrio sp.]|uniref:TrkH family potassium uptake protein n=1 Tax=Pseudodesulfovibrio sp. TaxID=2035812 RepID=UPI00261DB1D5|nr:TrkH family potassium uptake protein [Pseudodesulfovibrio sp.]MDD3312878.1 TrkH family potassium uptake protein [Pseudodesulfovibrio sp.]
MTFGGKVLKIHPAGLVLSSFLLAILAGASLLSLPWATRQGTIPLIDALFTATSAVCVTGLAVVDTGGFFTLFGQLVILALIQIGGLGVMTISVFLFRWMGRGISIRHRMAMQDVFAHTPREDILGLVRSIIYFTLTAELLGAVALTIQWVDDFGLRDALYYGVFHAVSAFCNAGFSTFPDSMTKFGDGAALNLTVCGLIVAGGLGFPVIHELRFRLRKRDGRRPRLSVQTKTVLWTTLLLIVAGGLLFLFLENPNSLHGTSLRHKMLASLFQSVTCRTAGFNTVDIGSLKDATLALIIFLMFFGASPGSCGGGVKTTTLALLTAFTWSRIKRRQRVNLFKKSIPPETVTRTMSLMLVSIGIIGVVLFLLLLGDTAIGHEASAPRGAFLTYLFETVSAFGTVGLSMGVTPQLGTWGKLWIILMMIVGRVGVLTFAYIVVGAGTSGGIEYSEENVMVG